MINDPLHTILNSQPTFVGNSFHLHVSNNRVPQMLNYSLFLINDAKKVPNNFFDSNFFIFRHIESNQQIHHQKTATFIFPTRWIKHKTTGNWSNFSQV